jgi:hypothetical protein
MTITFEEIKYYNSLPSLLSNNKLIFEPSNIENHKLNYFESDIEFLNKLIFEIQLKGFCVINLDNKIGIKEFSKLCTNVLGNLLPQTPDPKNTHYDVEYNPAKIKSTYQLNSNRAQPLHTDGHYNDITPKFIALYCEIQSITGGYSQVISAKKIHDFIFDMNSKILPCLFDTNSVNYVRKSPNGNGVFKYSKPLFVLQPDGKIGINYNPIMFQIQASKNIENCLRFINYYTNNPVNQIIFKLKPNEILIIDNQLFLHGRTCFPDDSIRKMQRFWFQGLTN